MGRLWIEATTLADLLGRAAERWPESRVVFADEQATFPELDERAGGVARALLAAGVRPGDKVGFLLAPGLDLLATLFGIAKLGATIVPINERFKSRELGYVVEHADLAALLTTDRVAEFLDFPALLRETFPDLAGSPDPRRLALAGAPKLRCVVLAGEGDEPGLVPLRELVGDAERIPAAAVAALQERVRVSDPAFVMYTSGTSAEPKGCLLTHEAFTRQGRAIAFARYGLRPDDVFWCPLPLFHNGAIATLLACLSSGASFCHPGHFDAGVALRQLEQERCTHAIPAFEAIWLPVLDHPRFAEADLSALRLVLHSGLPERLRQLQARVPQAVIISNYGSTEAAGHLSMTVPDDPLELRVNTCGHPLPGMEARIIDPESGRVLGPDELGEIQFRGPISFSGYYKAPGVTAEAFAPGGWFRSGDRGTLDADGRITFGGRLKDMLKVGGENVSAAEVEAYLLQHPAVRIAQVVAAPDARYVEVPAAFVELNGGSELTEEELIDYCVGRIATFKVPRYVRFVTEWPMSGTKIRKFALRDAIRDELAASGIAEAPRIDSRRRGG